MVGRFYPHREPSQDILPCVRHGTEFLGEKVPGHDLAGDVRDAGLHDCADSFVAYLNEWKALLSLRPAAVLQLLQRG
jgi:hypothetical protein